MFLERIVMKRRKAGLVVIALLAAVAFGAFNYYGNQNAEGRERLTQELRTQWSWVAASKDMSLIAPNDDEQFAILKMPVVSQEAEACSNGSCGFKSRPLRSVAKRGKLFTGRILRRVRCRN